MNIAAVFIAYFGIKETQFHPDTGAWREQYMLCPTLDSLSNKLQCFRPTNALEITEIVKNLLKPPVFYTITQYTALETLDLPFSVSKFSDSAK